MKLNGRHQLLAYADDVNILGGSVHTVKENGEALIVVSMENGQEVNADKSKYMVMSQYHNAGWTHSTKSDNSCFGRMEEFKYLGTTLTNQNCIQEEIKRRLKSGQVQNILTSSLLSKNLKVKIYKIMKSNTK